MARVPFPTGGTGDPSQGYRAFGFQALTDALGEGVPASAFTDVLGWGSQVAPTFNKLPQQKINATTMEQPGIPGKMGAAIQPFDFGDLDLGDLTQKRIIAQVLRGVGTTNPESGRYRHRVAQDQSGATAPQFGSMIVHDSDGYPRRHHDVVFSGFTIGAAGGQNVKLIAPFTYGGVDYHGIVVQTQGTAATVPTFRGFWSGNLDPDATDSDLYAQVSTATSSGVTGFKFKVGAAGTFDGAEVLITHGRWTGGLKYNAAGDVLGTEADEIEIYLPEGVSYTAGATPATYRVPKRRAVAAPSYSTRRLVAEVQTRSFFEGTDRMPLDGGWSVQVNRAGVARRDKAPGGRQPRGVRVWGLIQATVRIERSFVDATLQKRNMQQGVFPFVFTLKTDVKIGSTNTRYGMYIVTPGLEALGQPTYSVLPGASNETEVYELRAYQAETALSYDGLSFTAPVSVVIDDASSSLVA